MVAVRAMVIRSATMVLHPAALAGVVEPAVIAVAAGVGVIATAGVVRMVLVAARPALITLAWVVDISARIVGTTVIPVATWVRVISAPGVI